ncbi:MAG: hypothetical protein ACOY5B_12725 [Spirochaetota bacterium]
MKYLFAVCIAGVAVLAQDNAYRKYRGAWFEIQYPASFRVIPSLQSRGMPDEFDSVFFESPDRSVRFYIFSPQWAGETPDIALKDTQETYQLDKKESKDGFRKVWYTIRPKKTGRTRSYVETTNDDGTIRWVLGIEYADRKAYEKHLPLYNRFKTSLRQFSD